MTDFDFIVVGGGSAGYAAARTAGAAGARVALIEQGPVGGLCILRGCMPTKALLRSTEVLHLARTAADLGLRIPEVGFDFGAIMARKRELVKGLQDYRIDAIANAPNVTRLDGRARFVGPHEVEVDGRRLRAPKLMVSTGSVLSVPPVQGLREVGFIGSDEALELERLPARMVVLGGGVIATELGQYFARLGVQVTFVQRGGHLLSKEDEDVGMTLQAAFLEEGMAFLDHARLLRVERRGVDKVVVVQAHDQIHELVCDEILLATGRQPNVDGLDLDAAGIELDRHGVATDLQMRTSNPDVFAGGDVCGEHYLVHVAVYQGEIAGWNATHPQNCRQADYRLVPRAIFTDPNVAAVGVTERAAAAGGHEVLVGKFLFADLGKAELMGQTKGFVKLIARPDNGEIVGAQVIGPEGADLIHEIIVAMHFRSTAEQLLAVPHLHPTLSEIWTYPAEEICEQQQAAPVGA